MSDSPISTEKRGDILIVTSNNPPVNALNERAIDELVLVTARRWSSLAALRAGTPESGPTALVFRTGCSYRQRLEQVLAEFGWPSALRLEFGTLDGIIGCVAADMGVTLLPRAVVERSEQRRTAEALRADDDPSLTRSRCPRARPGRACHCHRRRHRWRAATW